MWNHFVKSFNQQKTRGTCFSRFSSFALLDTPTWTTSFIWANHFLSQFRKNVTNKILYLWFVSFPHLRNIILNIVIYDRDFLGNQVNSELSFNLQGGQQFDSFCACFYKRKMETVNLHFFGLSLRRITSVHKFNIFSCCYYGGET